MNEQSLSKPIRPPTKVRPPGTAVGNENVILTADDASRSKKTAVAKGYWKDAFIDEMIHTAPERKTPEINRGYFARTEAVWNVLNKFIQMTGAADAQVISLGAGLDTTYWRLHKAGCAPSKYVEVDFPQLTKKKTFLVMKSENLRAELEEPVNAAHEADLHSKSYNLIGCDLVDVEKLAESLVACGVNFERPTLFLTECVLMYVDQPASDRLLSFLSSKFSRPVFVSYDAVNMSDQFGKVMIRNLKHRNVFLHGLEACMSFENQRSRYERCGWTVVGMRTMWEIYLRLPDRATIERLEFFDEAELLEQLLEHYCIVIANKAGTCEGLQEAL